MQRQPVLVPVPQRVDLRLEARPAGEGVVVRDRAVVPQPQQLAGVRARILRARIERIRAESAADRQVQQAAGSERHTGSRGGSAERLGNEHVFDVAQRHALETSADDGDGAGLVRQGTRIADVHEPVLIESGMQRHVHQAGQASGQHLGYPFQWLRVEHAVANHPQAPRVALGDQDAAVGQEGHPPRMRQAPSPQRPRGLRRWRAC